MPPKPMELMLTTAAIAAGLDHEIVVAHHLVGIGMRDAEGIHHLLAGLLLVVEDQRHDRLHPFREAANRPGSSASRRP